MTILDEDLISNPDLFASEVHFCLLNGGTRSRAMRRLWKLAKGNSDLERLLEIKLAEFRRAAREERIPTVWNSPVRAAEWVSERVQFTPPRDVLTTIAYVVFVVVAMDAAKSKFPWKQIANHLLNGDDSAVSRAQYDSEFDLFALPPGRIPLDSTSRSDDAKAATKQKSPSPELPQALNDLPIDQLIEGRISDVLKSDAMKESLRQQMLAAMEGLSPEIAKSVNSAIASDGATQNIDIILQSAQFSEQLSHLLKNSIEAANLDELVAREVENKLRAMNLSPGVASSPPVAVPATASQDTVVPSVAVATDAATSTNPAGGTP